MLTFSRSSSSSLSISSTDCLVTAAGASAAGGAGVLTGADSGTGVTEGAGTFWGGSFGSSALFGDWNQIRHGHYLPLHSHTTNTTLTKITHHISPLNMTRDKHNSGHKQKLGRIIQLLWHEAALPNVNIIL